MLFIVLCCALFNFSVLDGFDAPVDSYCPVGACLLAGLAAGALFGVKDCKFRVFDAHDDVIVR